MKEYLHNSMGELLSAGCKNNPALIGVEAWKEGKHIHISRIPPSLANMNKYPFGGVVDGPINVMVQSFLNATIADCDRLIAELQYHKKRLSGFLIMKNENQIDLFETINK